MFNHAWTAKYVESTKEFNSTAVNKIHWTLVTSNTDTFNYSHTHHGTMNTAQDFAELTAMSAEDAIALVKSTLGTGVDALEQLGIQQIENMTVPIVEFIPTEEMLLSLVPPDAPTDAPTEAPGSV